MNKYQPSKFSTKNLEDDSITVSKHSLPQDSASLTCLINDAKEFVEIGPTVFQLLGYQAAELRGLSLISLIKPTHQPAINAHLSNVSTRQIEFANFESDIKHKNGSWRTLLWTIYCLDEEHLLLAAYDVTDYKLRELTLSGESNLMNALMQNIPDAIYFKDLQSRFVRVSKFVHLTGIDSPEQAIGKTDFDFFADDHARSTYEDEQRIMLTGEPIINKEEREVFPDGSTCWVSSSKAPVYDEKGHITGLVGVSRDITELKKITATALESEYKLRTLLQSMREGLLQVDNSDSIIFVNDYFCLMIAYSADELLGIDWKDLLYEEKDRQTVIAINERRGRGLADNYELCLKTKSGARLWALVGGAPFLNSEGLVIGSMGVFTDITLRKQAEERLRYEALHDHLTGLANRTLFNDYLQLSIDRAQRHDSMIFAVLFLDFDRFKIINDSLGHTEGDNLLKQIAGRISAVLRSGDLLARLGGDEFTILVSELENVSVALRIAERIQQQLQAPFLLSGSEVYISASIGITFGSERYNRAEEMLRDADIAMYRAKANGKAQYQVFNREMHEQAAFLLKLETELRSALDRSEFRLYYQPIFELSTGALTGFESLVRWQHPVYGLIPPHKFIPIAEDTNLILPLGKWILLESCRQLRAWRDDFELSDNLSVSVNLSTKQLLQPDLAEQVTNSLEKTGLKGHHLKLEITESQLMVNTETTIGMLKKIRSHGVELSLDDFGTGYSSLSYLHRLPFSYLKIDRSFIGELFENAESAEIVNTIIRLGQNLKMKIVAEGIESSEQLNHLKNLNCQYGQGYYLAKPMPAEMVSDFLQELPQIIDRLSDCSPDLPPENKTVLK